MRYLLELFVLLSVVGIINYAEKPKEVLIEPPIPVIKLTTEEASMKALDAMCSQEDYKFCYTELTPSVSKKNSLPM